MGLKLLQPKSVLLLWGALTDGQGHFTLQTKNKVITPSLNPSAQSFKVKHHPFYLLLDVIPLSVTHPGSPRIEWREAATPTTKSSMNEYWWKVLWKQLKPKLQHHLCLRKALNFPKSWAGLLKHHFQVTGYLSAVESYCYHSPLAFFFSINSFSVIQQGWLYDFICLFFIYPWEAKADLC